MKIQFFRRQLYVSRGEPSFSWILLLMTLSVFVSVAKALEPNDLPPDFALRDSSGRTVRLAELKGKVVYLDFWASWCAPCRHTFPWMQKIQQQYQSRGLEVVTINMDENVEDANEFLRDLRPKFTVLFDPNGQVAGAYQLPTMPSSFLITRDGRVASVHSGFREGDDSELEKRIQAALTQ